MIKKFLKSYILNPQSSSGFTLIELLIVVAIIGILAALLMTNFVGVRERARDAQRKSDLRQIQSALELYRSDNGGYPQQSTNQPPNDLNHAMSVGECPTSGSFAYNGTTYMAKIPCDPLGTNGLNNGSYIYISDGSTYTLDACIENMNDTDSNIIKENFTGCSSGAIFELHNP